MRGTRFCTERDVAIRRNSTLPTLDGRPVRTCGGTVRIPRARCHCHSLSLRARAPVVAGRVGSFDVPSQRVRGGQSATLDAEGVSDLLVKAINGTDEIQVSLDTRTLDFANGPRSAAQPAPQSPHPPLSTLGASDPPQRGACGHTVAFLSHADSACAMLTCCSACRRTMCGRILESNNMAHTDVGSASRACDSPAGRGGAREALARARYRCAFQRCSARMAPGGRGACFRAVVRVWGRAGHLSCLLCHV